MKIEKFDIHVYDKLGGKSILCKRNCTRLSMNGIILKFVDEEGNIIVLPSYALEKRYIVIR